MKHILVPTDFSECALTAAKTAVVLARKMGATLHFYSNVFIQGYYDYYGKDQQKILKENSEHVKKVESDFENLFAELDLIGINVIKEYNEGGIIQTILEYSKAAQIDLIVMGTHGVNGVKEWAIGSTTQYIVRKSICPVLVVKQELQSFDFKNIVFLSNFDENVKESFLEVCAFAKQFGSHIHLLNIDTPAYFTEVSFVVKKSMESFLKLYDGDITAHRIDAWNVENGLQKFLKKHEVDLVVIPTHGRKGLRGLFFTSIAEGIVNHVDIPIMTQQL